MICIHEYQIRTTNRFTVKEYLIFFLVQCEQHYMLNFKSNSITFKYIYILNKITFKKRFVFTSDKIKYQYCILFLKTCYIWTCNFFVKCIILSVECGELFSVWVVQNRCFFFHKRALRCTFETKCKTTSDFFLSQSYV